MAYTLAFITSGYSCAVRLKKPFNPILGETFEFIPADKRWKFFAEQVSHHPPIGVAEVVCSGYTLQLEMGLRTKFRGNSSDVFVDGSNHLFVSKFGDHFSWGHLDTCAHNGIIGGMWVDHFGTLEVKNHTTGDKGVLKFTRAGWLGAGRFEMTGEIFDSEGTLRLRLIGKWNEIVTAVKVQKDGTESAPILLWKKNPKPSTNKWDWPKFTEDLNAMDADYEKILPPTDSRLRGDRRYLEKEDYDTAGQEKHRLEEKQRAERKEREQKNEEWVPRYFQKVEDAERGHGWKYVGKYWEEREKRIQESQEKKSSGDTAVDPTNQPAISSENKEEVKDVTPQPENTVDEKKEQNTQQQT
jgi:hypothetical protein